MRSDNFLNVRIASVAASVFAILLSLAPGANSQSGVTVNGVILDVTGGAVAGASVRLYSMDRVRETRAGADGQFAFPGLAAGTYDLESSFPGFRTQTIENIAITDKVPEPFSFKLQPGIGDSCAEIGTEGGYYGAFASYQGRLNEVDVAGIVRDRLGSSLSHAALKLVRADESHSIVSNDSGEFDFANLPPGKYVLNVSLDGYWGVSRNLWLTRENLAKLTVTLPTKREIACVHER
jgi:hypothetical protein